MTINEKSRVSLKVGCLPYAVEKQPSIPLINLGKKWTLSWWWWWLFWYLGGVMWTVSLLWTASWKSHAIFKLSFISYAWWRDWTCGFEAATIDQCIAECIDLFCCLYAWCDIKYIACWWLFILLLCRYMLGLAAVPSFIQFVGFMFMPESPRWLVSKGRIEEAYHLLLRLDGDQVSVENDLIEIQKSSSESSGLIFGPSWFQPWFASARIAQGTGVWPTLLHLTPTSFCELHLNHFQDIN